MASMTAGRSYGLTKTRSAYLGTRSSTTFGCVDVMITGVGSGPSLVRALNEHSSRASSRVDLACGTLTFLCLTSIVAATVPAVRQPGAEEVRCDALSPLPAAGRSRSATQAHPCEVS